MKERHVSAWHEGKDFAIFMYRRLVVLLGGGGGGGGDLRLTAPCQLSF